MEKTALQLKNGLLLMLAAFIWGSAFVAQSVGMDYVGPCTFNAVRNYIGALVLLPVIALFSRKGEKKEDLSINPGESFIKRNRILIIGGILCGLALGAGSLLQQAGLQYTTAGKAGFLTALYIVIVPVLGIFMKRMPGLTVWLGVALALMGAYCLSVTEGFSIALGDLLVLTSALFFSIHILVIDRFSPKVDGVKLSCLQFFVSAIVSTFFAVIFENIDFSAILSAWIPLLYTGVLSSGVAYTLQIIGQKGMNPTVASLILSLESVFAALSGWVILKEPLSLREIFGCILVFSAVVLAQLPSKRNKQTERE